MIVLLLASVLCATARATAGWRACGFAGAWFFITLAMSSSFFPIRDLAFEHRMYLALASVAALCVVLLNAGIPGGALAFYERAIVTGGIHVAPARAGSGPPGPPRCAENPPRHLARSTPTPRFL